MAEPSVEEVQRELQELFGKRRTKVAETSRPQTMSVEKAREIFWYHIREAS